MIDKQRKKKGCLQITCISEESFSRRDGCGEHSALIANNAQSELVFGRNHVKVARKQKTKINEKRRRENKENAIGTEK